METLVDIFGHMPLHSSVVTAQIVTIVPVPRNLVVSLVPLLVCTTTVSLDSLVSMKLASPLKTHCGTAMDVVRVTTAVLMLGCRGSVGPSHRK